MDPRSNNSNRAPANVLRAANLPNNHVSPHIPPPFGMHEAVTSTPTPVRRHHEEPAGLWAPHSHLPSTYPAHDEAWKASKHFGAARLFHYMEASDTSEPENDPEEEPPPFICRECGCEFVDDTSLETHVFMHHRALKLETLRPPDKYAKCLNETKSSEHPNKRSRKQDQPKKVSESDEPKAEIRVLRRVHKGQRRLVDESFIRLRDRHITNLVLRRRLRCFPCSLSSSSFPYHTTTSIVLHRLWRHRQDRFHCEHCSSKFRHRYQVVLHASRHHLAAPLESQELYINSDQQCPSPSNTLINLQPTYKSNYVFPTSKTLQELSPMQSIDELKSNQTEVHTTYKVLQLESHSSTSSYGNSSSMALIIPPFPQTA